MYEYRAKVIRVVDGDTLHLDVDQGFDSHLLLTVRLLGINAPENSTAEGKITTAYLKERIEGKEIFLKTQKDRREKYGRYLADIYLDNVCINDELLEKRYASIYP
jgi:micrococcal nuclease